MVILYCLMEFGIVRFNELKRYLGTVSDKTLSSSLKELERDELIVRKEYPQIPPKVEYSLRACLIIHSRHLHAPLCGIFDSNSVSVAHYASFIGAKSSTKCDIHLAESNFQTRSSERGKDLMKILDELCIWGENNRR